MRIGLDPSMSQQLASSIEQQLREQLSNTIGKRPYRMWFSNTDVQCNEDRIEILASTPLAASWITNRFSAVIEDAAKHTMGRDIPVHISVQEPTTSQVQQTGPIERERPPAKKRKLTRKLLSFDDFVVGSCNQLACAAAKQITEEDGKSISPLFIHGVCGVGKTHLLQAICNSVTLFTAACTVE